MFDRVGRIIFALLLLGCLGSVAQAAQDTTVSLPTGFEASVVATVTKPTGLAFTFDKRLLIATQPGKLWVVQNNALAPTPALDLAAVTCSNFERGMDGVVADPNFASNHYIYVYYTFKKFGNCDQDKPNSPVNRLSRFTLPDSNLVDKATEKPLLDNIPSPEGVHNSGDLHFGKDGYLYVSVGDGGCYYADSQKCYVSNPSAQQLNLLNGKIIRITSDGGVPPENPMRGDNSTSCATTGPVAQGKICQEIFAYGLRNPFRMAFDENAPDTRFYINDVGHNVREEINEGKSGANYGWNAREGHCLVNSSTNCGPQPKGMTNPIYDYSHEDGCKAITGGAFVPKGLWPAPLSGAYLFSDYKCGTIFQLAQRDDTYSRTPFLTGLGINSATGMTFGPYNDTQALYYAAYTTGEIHAIRYTNTGPRTPIAIVYAKPPYGSGPLEVTFDASSSSISIDAQQSYRWDFGDGSPVVETPDAKIKHTYANNGTYEATLKLRDADNNLDAAPVSVRVDVGNTPPKVKVSLPKGFKQYSVGQSITVKASATDDEDGKLAAESIAWRVLMRNNDKETPIIQATTGLSITFKAPPPDDLLATTNSYIEVTVTVTDSKGLQQLVKQKLQPKVVNITFHASPPNRQLVVNSMVITTSQTVSAWSGYALHVQVPPQRDALGNVLAMGQWNDGDTTTERTLITPGKSTTYTVTLAAQPRANRWPLVAGGSAALVALGGAGLVVARRRRSARMTR